MSLTDYVDPGVHGSGCATYHDGTLLHAEYRSTPLPYVQGARCVAEKPVVYSREAKARMGKDVDDQDIVALAIALGRMTANLPTTYVTPAQWKGSRSKKIMHARLLDSSKGLLTDGERAILEKLDCAPSLRHNVYDAVCMGLCLEGRWK